MSYPKEKLIELTKRIYQLTLCFPKKEPLRYKIREIADEILLNVIRGTKNPTHKDWEVLDSFLEIAKEQNWVSPKAILDVKKEYQDLFENLYIPSIKSQENLNLRENTLNGVRPHLNLNGVEPQVVHEPQVIHVNERQRKILEILKEREKIQVGQVKEFFPNVSKRTLRRDFQKLVKKGIIERIGEKNNTFYKLKELWIN